MKKQRCSLVENSISTEHVPCVHCDVAAVAEILQYSTLQLKIAS